LLKKITLFFIILYAIVGFIIVPIIAKPQIIDIFSKQINAKLSIEKIYFNPFSFCLKISNIKLNSLDNKELLSLKSIKLNLEVSSLINKTAHVKSFILNEPRVSLVLNKNKEINFSSIIKESDNKKVVKKDSVNIIPRIVIDKIAIVNGSLNYDDYSLNSKFSVGLKEINFKLNNIDTKNITQNNAKVKLHMRLDDGGFIDLKSDILDIEPLILKGKLNYEASKLYTKWRYLQDYLNFEVADGKIFLNTDYYFNQDNLDLTTLSNLNINLKKLRIKPKGDYKDILTLSSLSFKDITLKPFIQKIHINKILLNSLFVKSKRDKNGNIDWQKFIKINSKAKPQKKARNKSKKTKPWDVLVDSVALENIKVNFNDKAIKPSVKTILQELNIYAKNITLEGKKPFKYEMNLVLNNNLKCKSSGDIVHDILNINSFVECKNINIVHYRPYIDKVARDSLKLYDVRLRSLNAGFNTNLKLKKINSKINLEFKNANINLNKFSLNQRSNNKRLLDFNNLNISGINLNTSNKNISIKSTVLNKLNIRASRLKNKTINLENLIKVKKSQKVKKSKKEKSYRVKLKKVALKNSKITFEDKVLSPSTKTKIDKIYITLKDIDSKKYSWMRYSLNAKINNSGKISSSGKIRHTPLKQKGEVKLDKISLKELTPYLQEKAYIILDDGYLNLNTKTSYEVSKNKPDINLDGSFKLEEVFINDSRDKSSLISFSDIHLKKFTLELFPNRLFVEEMDIDSFYVNAMIDTNQIMNFSTLLKPEKESNKKTIVTNKNVPKTDPFPIKLMKINVSLGSAQFSDASLPVEFKTSIHDLNGEIYAVSSIPNEISYIDISGEIDKYGSTKLNGSINPFNPNAYTDLSFNFRNLDLSAMSGYSGTFAGYKIKKGKLFLDLNYGIMDSNLTGENSIIVKHIKLGEEIKSKNSLPLGLVVALLEDTDGNIDIDMPVRGNVDTPDFRYGALIWKTFENLILKAVTSPFRFLGSMLGMNGDDLEYAEFEAGSYNILPSEREKLDNIAKLLRKRPKIILSITGQYNEKTDKLAIQKLKLIDKVVKSSGAKNEKDKISAMTVDLLEDIYSDTVDDDKMDKLKDKLHSKYKGEIYKRAYLKALIKLCSKIQKVSVEDMETLANKRAKALKTYLVDTKAIKISRIQNHKVTTVGLNGKKLVKSKLEIIIK